MNKIFLMLFFVGLLLVGTVSAANWYVSTTSSGTASGDSWANKRTLKDFTESWYGTRVKPGDIVYIDGGSTNLTYKYGQHNNSQWATFFWNKAGTAYNRITITRGRDSGHNGIPIIEGAFGSGKNAFYGYASYFTLANLTFTNKDNYNSRAGRYLILLGAHPIGVHILSNTLRYTYGTAIRVDSSENVKIMYNSITTGVTDEKYTEDAFFFDSGGNGTEIAYNYVLNENNFDNRPPFNATTNPEGAHADLFQFTGTYQSTGGATKIHHNFLGNIQDTDGYGKQVLYLNQVAGVFEIYNNIIVTASRNTNMYGSDDITLTDIVNDNPTKLIGKIYNNNIVSDAFYPGSRFYRVDEFTFKNNLVYYPNIISGGNGAVFTFNYGSQNASLDIDYNRYHKTNLVRFVEMTPNIISWDTWRSKYGVDAHSSIGPVNFRNLWGTQPSDYMLVDGSEGIDDGTPVIGIVDDFVGTSRPQGSAWDIGAFEYVVGSVYHPADLNTDGCVSLGEISTYVGRWLNGQITLGTVSSGVSEWLGGC